MTNKELETLAHRVAEIVLDKIVNYYDNHETLEIYRPSEKEVLAMEIDRLNHLLSKYVDKEDYKKATIIKRKLEILNNKLDNI
tara:strand:- start:763 stop:1011 length:249 start_codon:yes stop_codon:yes gene_type:complete